MSTTHLADGTKAYGRKWQRARAAFLLLNPYCIDCHKKGRLTRAAVVDHLQDHKGDVALFWDERNWQPLCKSCHNAKTSRTHRRGKPKPEGNGTACRVDGLPVGRGHPWGKFSH